MRAQTPARPGKVIKDLCIRQVKTVSEVRVGWAWRVDVLDKVVGRKHREVGFTPLPPRFLLKGDESLGKDAPNPLRAEPLVLGRILGSDILGHSVNGDHDSPPTALDAALGLEMMPGESVRTDPEKRPEPPLPRIESLEPGFLERGNEELLRQILGILALQLPPALEQTDHRVTVDPTDEVGGNLPAGWIPGGQLQEDGVPCVGETWRRRLVGE